MHTHIYIHRERERERERETEREPGEAEDRCTNGVGCVCVYKNKSSDMREERRWWLIQLKRAESSFIERPKRKENKGSGRCALV